MEFLHNRCSSGVWWNYKTNLRENIFLKNDIAIRDSSLPTFQQFHFLHLQKKEQIKNIQKGRTKLKDTFYLNGK